MLSSSSRRDREHASRGEGHDELAEVQQLVIEVPFPAAHAKMLDKVIALKTSGVLAPSMALVKQHYDNFVHFLPMSVWEKLSGDSGPSCLCDFLVQKLGLLNPSERTFQWIAIVLMLASEGLEKAINLSRPI